MHAADTNVLVRLLIRDDAAQVATAEEFVRRGAWASHVVIVEVAWVLKSSYGLEAKEIADALEMLLAERGLVIHEPDVVRSALRGFRRKPSVEFSDHLILESARKAGHLPLGAFDRGLGKLDGAQAL